MSVGRALRTVRFLRPVQMADRVTRRLRPLPPSPRAPARLIRTAACPPAIPGPPVFDGAAVRLLNVTHPFAGSDRWQPAGASALWVYTLHGFRYLWGLDAARAKAVVLDAAARAAPDATLCSNVKRRRANYFLRINPTE